MGIYDRDYYRREGPSYIGSFMQRGKVCKWLIIINIGFFILQTFSPEQTPAVPQEPEGFEAPRRQQPQLLTEFMRLDTQAVRNGQVWRLLTYAFVHGSFFHILFNMLFLWWLGTDMEDMYGPVEFLTFYLISAIVGGLAFVAAWVAGWSDAQFCVGASGAVMAVTVLCALHYPSRIIWIYFVPMPIWLFVLFQVAMDWTTFAGQVRTGTAVTVHLGGAIFGFAYYKLQWRLSGWFTGFKLAQRRRPRARLRVYREEEESKPAALHESAASDMDEQLEAKLDIILEKVARSGQASLTENEKQILLRASEVYKRKKT
jgi:membrane associated rhomboid family serine protease